MHRYSTCLTKFFGEATHPLPVIITLRRAPLALAWAMNFNPVNMLDYLESFLFTISVALFYPVLIGLCGLVAWTALSLGKFTGELLQRRKRSTSPLLRFKKHNQERLGLALREGKNADMALTKLLREWERKEINLLDGIRFIVKTGPAIGLIGTLIPMGTALSSLSEGDMMAMSTNMVTAFTSTIIGLACSTVAYLISMTREKWLKADFLECEIYCEQLLRETDGAAVLAHDNKNN